MCQLLLFCLFLCSMSVCLPVCDVLFCFIIFFLLCLFADLLFLPNHLLFFGKLLLVFFGVIPYLLDSICVYEIVQLKL